MAKDKLAYMRAMFRKLYASEIADQNPPTNSKQSHRFHGLDGKSGFDTKGTCQDTARKSGDAKHSVS